MPSNDDTGSAGLSPERTRNLVMRTWAAMTSLPAHEGTGETWVVLVPDKLDWKPLSANAGAAPSQRYVFANENLAKTAAEQVAGAVVFGGWSPVLGNQKEVREVVVHYSDNTTQAFPGEEYDAVFWSPAAKQKFLASYYGATDGVALMTMMQSSSNLASGHKRWCVSDSP